MREHCKERVGGVVMGIEWYVECIGPESAAHAEDTVVGLLGRETLEGEKDGLGL